MPTMTVQHTPGPWSIAPHPDDAEVLEIVADYSELPGGRKAALWVAELDAGGLDDNRDALRANASLISAAPELLASLHTLLYGFETGVFVRDVTRDADASWAMRLIPFVQALQQAQAAVLKANGGVA